MRQLTFTPAGLPDEERTRYEAIAKELADFEQSNGADKPEPAPTTLTIGDIGATAPPITIAGSSDTTPVEPRTPTVLGGELAEIVLDRRA